ncbi:MAG: GNAT family N-acetyltransferase [Candidatus Dormibacteraeota bacterium]|nr:GNAT family N-acetyltransferase [Candidatus Dormibacteraeota bacterium]
MIRPAEPGDAPGIARVYVSSWRTTYPGMMPQDYLDSLDEAMLTARWAQRLEQRAGSGANFVAEVEGQVVGFASGGPEREGDTRYRGELYAIYLLEGWQQRGLGRELAQAVARALAGQGLHSMLVWVLRENWSARSFYERLGGVYLRQHMLDFGAGFEVPEVSYGWEDIERGLAAARD